jgi:hypothetical protein
VTSARSEYLAPIITARGRCANIHPVGSFTWPVFNREALDGIRAWAATFDSYDQYHEDVYYAVRLRDGERDIGEFMVQVGMEFAPGNDWDTPEFLTELRARIASVATTGKTNTTHV